MSCPMPLKLYRRSVDVKCYVSMNFELNWTRADCARCVGSDLVLPHDYHMGQTLHSSILMRIHPITTKLHRRIRNYCI